MSRYIRFIRLIGLMSLIGVTVALWHTVTALAQSATPSLGLTLSPPTFEITGNPGDTITNTVRLENTNDFPISLAVDRRNFTAQGEEGSVGLTEEATAYSLASWISVSPETTTIPGKTTRSFTYTISIPLNAEPGGHFGSLVFRTIPSAALSGSGAALAQEIGSLILLNVSGYSIQDARIVDFEPTQSLFEYGPITLSARVENLGNVHVKPSGTVTITNTFGSKVASLKVEGKNVLPGAIRKLETVWDNKWGFGRYTATFVMVYGTDLTQRAAVTNFYVFPYRLVLVIIVIALVIGLVLYKMRKRLSLAWKILTSSK